MRKKKGGGGGGGGAGEGVKEATMVILSALRAVSDLSGLRDERSASLSCPVIQDCALWRAPDPYQCGKRP